MSIERFMHASVHNAFHGNASMPTLPPRCALLGGCIGMIVAVVPVVAGAEAPSGGPQALASALQQRFEMPFGVELSRDGDLYVTEIGAHRIRRINHRTGEVLTVAGSGQRGYAGDGGPAREAALDEPYEVRFDSGGNMYFVELKNHLIRRVDARTGRISTIAGGGRPGFAGDGRPAAQALFDHPHSLAIDRQDAIYIADVGNHRIRRIDPATGLIDSIAGNGEPALPRDGQAAEGNPLLGPRALCIAGDELWIALREGNSVWRMNLEDGVLHHVAGTGQAGYSGDGGNARKATFQGPKGIAVGPNGAVYVVDSGNNAVRAIDVQRGAIDTLALPENAGGATVPGKDGVGSTLNQPHGICVAADGDVFIGDTLNHRVLRIPTAE
jgi:streptogramin lyase